MALKIIKRCNRCLHPMRNDGTEEKPIWVCDNSEKPCVKYKPPKTNKDE